MKIFINPGHAPGGIPDPGAVGPSGLRESDVTADVSAMVVEYLQAAGCEAMSYQSDSLQDICDTSNAWGADLFVSIHCNSAENMNARGTETFCYSRGGNGEQLAECIQAQIVDSLGTVDRGVKTANFYVLRNTECPAVLVETAFISNAVDEVLLADESKQDEFARAIARGVTDYEVMMQWTKKN